MNQLQLSSIIAINIQLRKCPVKILTQDSEADRNARKGGQVHAKEDAVLPLEGGQGAALPRDREHPLPLCADGKEASLLVLNAAVTQ